MMSDDLGDPAQDLLLHAAREGALSSIPYPVNFWMVV